MNKLVLAAVATVAGSALAGAAVLPGSAAPEAVSHTRHYVLIQTGSHGIGKFTFAGTDKVRKAGKVVGFDSVTGRFSRPQNRVVIQAAFALRGGLILAKLHNVAATGPGGPLDFTGRITGGTGTYHGITGTVDAHQPTDSSKKTFLTLTYTK
jgi:hypothetical protein